MIRKKTDFSIPNNDKLSLISNLSTMLTAGIPILETVDALLEDSKGGTKKILDTMREDLIQGKQLNSSLSKFPMVFDKVTINVIKASEEAGTLDITLKDLKEQIRKDMEFSDKVKSAMVYPLVIVLVFFGVLLMMLTVVIPRISTVFSRLNVTLPLPTRIMIFVSNLLMTYTIPVIIIFLALIIIMLFFYKAKKQVVVNLFSSLPLISNLVLQIDLTRFSRSLYLLLISGITINTALELTQQVVIKKNVANAIRNARDVVLAGRKMSEGFKETKGVFSGIMLKIIEAGERTGTLDKSMQDISDYLDYQVTTSLKNLTTLLEPIMLVVVGVMVGGMMMAIIAPIYGLIGQVTQR